ncbi:MAG TPA: CoA pyrophosphatase [Actinomycetota bacterium]|nr:CoA pyrophosphatase [Actinomycetota bacterium]
MIDIPSLRERLAEIEHLPAPEGVVEAAVLVPLIETETGWQLIFTRRSEDLRNHGGEISFPGGRVDAHESAVEAALREAHEEVGINPREVEVLGKLRPVFTIVSGYSIEPWVGVIPHNDFSPNPAEIADVIEIPIATLREPGTRRVQRFIRSGGIYRNPAFDVGPNTIWGATARILDQLLEII